MSGFGSSQVSIPMRQLDVERFRPENPASSIEESMLRIHNQNQSMMGKIASVLGGVKRDAAMLFPGLAQRGAFGPQFLNGGPFASASQPGLMTLQKTGQVPGQETRLFPGAPTDAATASPASLSWPSGLELGQLPGSSSDWQNRQLPQSSFRGRELEGHNFQGAALREGDFNHAKLKGANFAHADASGANFGRADLSGVNFNKARLIGANMGFAQLVGAQLRQARLDNANLKGANLERANLAQARLMGADLSGARLGGADFRNANFAGSRLAGADLRGARNWEEANFQGAEYDAQTKFPAGFDPEKHGLKRK